MNTQQIKHSIPILLVIALLLILLAANPAQAQTDGDYKLTWWTIDSGGGTATGNGFTLMGTFGQPEPGPDIHGSSYTLTSGFWPGGITGTGKFDAFLPMTIR